MWHASSLSFSFLRLIQTETEGIVSLKRKKNWAYFQWQHQDSERFRQVDPTNWNKRKKINKDECQFLHSSSNNQLPKQSTGVPGLSWLFKYGENSGTIEIYTAKFKSTWGCARELLIFSSCILLFVFFCLLSAVTS